MAQTLHQIQALLAEAGIHPRHRFGQNFMIDQNLVRLVADAGQIHPGDLVIEIGPGTGTLTEELLARGAEVCAVEIDRDLAALLRRRLAGREGFRLIEGDALAGKHELNSELAEVIVTAQNAGQAVRLVANLPYNTATPLIIELLIARLRVLAFTVQKEVAQRLRARPGTEAYGALSVMAGLLGRVEVLRVLPPQAFWPAPKIDSGLVRITLEDRLGTEARPFGQFVQRLFGARRKTLRKALEQMNLDAEPLLAGIGVDPRLRPENLSPEQFLQIHRAAQGISPA